MVKMATKEGRNPEVKGKPGRCYLISYFVQLGINPAVLLRTHVVEKLENLKEKNQRIFAFPARKVAEMSTKRRGNPRGKRKPGRYSLIPQLIQPGINPSRAVGNTLRGTMFGRKKRRKQNFQLENSLINGLTLKKGLKRSNKTNR